MIELYINKSRIIGFLRINDSSPDKYYHYKDYVLEQILNGKIYNQIILTTTKIDYQPTKSTLCLKDFWNRHPSFFSISESMWQELEQYV